MLVEELKEILEEILDSMDFYEIKKLEDFPKFKRIYQNIYPLDNIEINWCLTKDGDKNVIEVISFHDNEDGTREICRVYELCTNIIMQMKDEEFDLSNFVKYTIERIKKSFEV